MVYVFGEVVEQGFHTIPPFGMTLLQLLARSRGMDTIDAQTRSLYLARPRGDRVVVYEIHFGDLLRAPEVALYEGDRVFVPPTGLSKWNRWWRQAIPFTTAVRAVYRPEAGDPLF